MCVCKVVPTERETEKDWRPFVPDRFHIYKSRTSGTDHLVAPGNICWTCGQSTHPPEFSAQDNRDWVAATLQETDWVFCRILDLAVSQAADSLALVP